MNTQLLQSKFREDLIMRKILIAVMALLLMVVLGGCMNNTPADFDEEALKNESTLFGEMIAKGEYNSVRDRFSSGLKTKLSGEQLKEGWDKIARNIGTFEGVERTDIALDRTTAKATVVLKFEDNKGIQVVFSYDRESEITGLWLNYAPILMSSDAFEEVEIAIGEGEETLTGILTLPKGVENPDVALLIQGSGQHDLDESIGAAVNKPFRDIAHGLAKEGIASVRYNKRFFQYPSSAGDKITIESEVLNDANAALKFIENDERINKGKTVVIGHSLGAMMAPKIASDNKSVNGIISLAGSPRGLEEIIYDQNVAFTDKDTGKTEEEKTEALKQMKDEVDRIKALQESGGFGEILGVNVEYWNSLNNIDIVEIGKSLNIPMLFLQGDADFQVSKDRDFGYWKEVLAGKSNAIFKLYEGLNHLFMPTTGADDVTDYDPKNSVDPAVIKEMADWIKSIPR